RRGCRPAQRTWETDSRVRLRVGRTRPEGEERRGPRDPAARDRGVRQRQAQGKGPRDVVRLLHCRGPADARDRQAPRRRPRAAREDAPARAADGGPDEPDQLLAKHGPRPEPRQADVPRGDRDPGHAPGGSRGESGCPHAPGRGQARARTPALVQLRETIQGQTAVVTADINPFRLFKELEATKTRAPARGGEVAPEDLWVRAGETPFKPGPVVGELQKAGIPAAIERGK